MAEERQIVLNKVSKNGDYLGLVPDQMKKDREIVLAAVRQYGPAIRFADNEFKMDREIVSAAVQQFGPAIKLVDQSLKNDEEIVLAAVKNYSQSFLYADKLKEDQNFLLQVVAVNGQSFSFINQTLRQNREFVLEAVRKNFNVFTYCKSFKKDEEIALEAIKQSASALKEVDDSLKNNKEFLLKSARTNGLVLEFVKETFKTHDFVLTAVRQNGRALKFCGAFKNVREIALEAVKQTPEAVPFLEEQFLKAGEFVLEVVSLCEEAFKYFDTLRSDEKFVLQVLKKNLKAFLYADIALTLNQKFIVRAIQQNSDLFLLIKEQYMNNREIVVAAIKQNGLLLEYVDEMFKQEKLIVMEAVQQNGKALKFVKGGLSKDRELVLKAIRQNGASLEFSDEFFKKDREIVVEAIKQNAEAIKYADRKLSHNREFLLEIVKDEQNVLHYIKDSIKHDILFLYRLFKQNAVYASFIFPEKTRAIEKHNNLHKKLSENILDQYSVDLIDETELYYSIELGPLYKPFKKSSESSYSIPFVEKMIIFQILKQINHNNPNKMEPPSPITNFFKTAMGSQINRFIKDVDTIANQASIEQFENDLDYYLFCFRLIKFIEDNQVSNTEAHNLKMIVEKITTKFDTSLYTANEIQKVMKFKTWFDNEHTFENYRNQLSRYKSLTNDPSKIFYALEHYYAHFKNGYDFISVIGFGGEGVVFKVFDKKRKALVALKLKYDQECNEESAIENLNILKRTDIEGKVIYFDCGVIGQRIFSVMELGEESLKDYIQRNQKMEVYSPKGLIGGYKLIELLEIFIKILHSVKSVHDHNVVHRDLDPSNIVKIQDNYKIIDFETSRVIKTGRTITLGIGKFDYMSPEVSRNFYSDKTYLLNKNDNEKILCNLGNVNVASDIFSLGCILFKLLTNCILKLSSKFINNPVANYSSDYFSDNGIYFYAVVTTTEGERSLHYAIERAINLYIDSNLGVNAFLVSCIITMIRRDASERMDCFSHITALQQIVNFLKNKTERERSELESQMKNFSSVAPLKSYSQLLRENENQQVEINKLKEEISNLKRLNEK